MGPYKLLALDMDGTLLDEEKKISEENKQWIQAAKEAGVTVVLSTGRGIQNVLPFAEELQLDTPMVTVNGSEVWKKPNVLYHRTLMDVEAIVQMHRIALHYDVWFWAYALSGIYNKNHWTEQVYQEEWLKFGYYTENSEILTQIVKEINAIGEFEITNSHPCNIEINVKGSNKAVGVKMVCDLLDLSMSEVIAMGDSTNDIAMLQAAGLGVAMGNAQEEVKQIADVVTLDNEENGVAHIIQQFIFSNTDRG